MSVQAKLETPKRTASVLPALHAPVFRFLLTRMSAFLSLLIELLLPDTGPKVPILRVGDNEREIFRMGELLEVENKVERKEKRILVNVPRRL